MIPVVFDLDGTLIDSLPDITEAANALLRDEGQPSIGPEIVAGFIGLGEQVFLTRLISATALVPDDFDRLMPRFIEHYRGATGNTRLFPGVREALDHFHAAGVPMALCTNKPSVPLWPVLEAVGIRGDFDVIVAGDTLAARKPDPAPLLHIMSELNVSRCVYVGDSETDAETAQRAKMPFALFTEGIRQSPVEAIPHDAIFSDFADLPRIHEMLAKSYRD